MVKWSNPEKGVAPSPTSRCCSYWKGSLLVTLDYGRQLYLLFTLQLPGGNELGRNANKRIFHARLSPVLEPDHQIRFRFTPQAPFLGLFIFLFREYDKHIENSGGRAFFKIQNAKIVTVKNFRLFPFRTALPSSIKLFVLLIQGISILLRVFDEFPDKNLSNVCQKLIHQMKGLFVFRDQLLLFCS